MAETNDHLITDLLRQLQNAGAEVRDAKGKEAVPPAKLTKLTEAALKDLNRTPADFGAWVSWSKSF
jgi:hypothetical protein